MPMHVLKKIETINITKVQINKKKIYILRGFEMFQ